MSGWNEIPPEQHKKNLTGGWADLSPDQHKQSSVKPDGVGQLIQTNIDALPDYGQAAGSFIAFGNPVVAGAGRAAGSSLKNTINAVTNTNLQNEMRLPTQEEITAVVNDAMKNFNEGATLEMGGKLIAGGLEKLMRRAPSIPGQTNVSKGAAQGEQVQGAGAAANGKAQASAEISAGGSTAEQGGSLFEFKAPQSLDELRNWKPLPETGEMVGKKRLAEIQSIIPDLRIKPMKYHFDMMENPKAMKELKLAFENMPTADAKQIATYNQEIVNESGRRVKSLIKSVTGGRDPAPLSDAAEGFLTSVRDKFQNTRDELSPVFEELKKQGQSLTDENAKKLIRNIADKTKIGKLLEEIKEPIMQVGADGKKMQVGEKLILKLGKNRPRTGVSPEEYRVISDVIDDLNEGISFQEIQRTREFLRKSENPLNQSANEEIQKVRKVLLDALETMTPGDVQPAMKQYAVNQRALENIEKIIGGKIETLDQMYAANPDKVVQKVFSNPNHAKIVAEYVGPETTSEMLASYINHGVKNSFDSATGFSPVKLRQWVKTNDTFLKNYVNPQITEQLKALADYGYFGKRFLDEVNPSGTAASLNAMIKPGGFFQKISTGDVRGAITSQAEQSVFSKVKQRQAAKFVNNSLLENPPQKGKMFIQQEAENFINSPDSIRDVTTRAAAQTGGSSGAVSGQLGFKASEEKPKKGPEKWANDGVQKLQEHGSPFSDQQIEKLRQSKKGKELLIRASDIKPKSKAMDRMAQDINKFLQGGE